MDRTTGGADVTNRVRSRRLAAGLSQQALAERVAVTRQAIVAIEGGRYVPNTALALRLARALGCTVEALFSLPDRPVCVQAELLDTAATGQAPWRVQLARVGDRLLAAPLRGSAATGSAADGLVLASDTPATIELLIPPARLDGAVVVCGCDPALALLGAHLSRRYPAFRLLWLQRGSLAALRALARNEAHIAGTHLPDPAGGESNLPYVRRELAGRDLVLITLSEWQQGLIVAAGNPRGIAEAADLARPELVIINREPGSGSRMLLDAWLAEAGIPSAAVHGYRREVAGHAAVADAVAMGLADAGPGILAVARALDLGFLPLAVERYDLVIPTAYLHTEPVQALLDVAMSAAFRREMGSLGGYDSRQTGNVVAELAS